MGIYSRISRYWAASSSGLPASKTAEFSAQRNVELNDLTDMVDNVVEGGIVMAKALGNQNWHSAK